MLENFLLALAERLQSGGQQRAARNTETTQYGKLVAGGKGKS